MLNQVVQRVLAPVGELLYYYYYYLSPKCTLELYAKFYLKFKIVPES